MFKEYREKKYAEYVEKTNEEVVSIINGYVPEIMELFYKNKEVFVKQISKDTPSDTINIDDERISFYIKDISTLVKNAIYFTVNSTMGTIDSVFYSISIVYFQDEIFDGNIFNSRFERFVKLDSNWYIYKEFHWGT